MTDQQNNPHRIRAKRLLRHYFKVIAATTDTVLNQDCYAEIDDIIDDIIDAAAAQVQANRPEEEQAGQSYTEYFHGTKRNESEK